MNAKIRNDWMKQSLASLLLAAALIPFARDASASEPLDLFDTEDAAIEHCGDDIVVWLDVPSNRYEYKGEEGYGETGAGGYTCKRDADRSGNRAMKREN
jgi:hypothetical protein